MEWALIGVGVVAVGTGVWLFVRARSTRGAWWPGAVVAVAGVALTIAGIALMPPAAPETNADSTAVQPAAVESDATSATAGTGEPTATGSPAAPPTPKGMAPSGEANAYATDLVKINTRMGELLGDLAKRLVVADLDDAKWAAATRTTLGSMADIAADARALKAAPGYEAVHSAWMAGVEDYAWAVDNMSTAIAEKDMALFEQSNTRLAEASASFSEAMALLYAEGEGDAP